MSSVSTFFGKVQDLDCEVHQGPQLLGIVRSGLDVACFISVTASNENGISASVSILSPSCTT